MLSQQQKVKFIRLLGCEWFEVLKPYFQTKDFDWLAAELLRERQLYTVYPEQGSELLFKAFRTTPFSEVKVVILGQDPYHDGSYDGFAFSNTGKTSLSPSLRNIFKEVEDDVYDGLRLDQDPNLQRWAEQGVLLINTAHTVREGEPASHLHLWSMFTRKVIASLAELNEPIVWMLWGTKARKHLDAISLSKSQLKLTSAHPSPFSAHAGFYGCKHFSQANKFLEDNGLRTINW